MRAALGLMVMAAIFGFLSFKHYFNNSISLVPTDETLSHRQLSSSWIRRHPERGVSSWARNNFSPLSASPDEKEVILFWHIPKSGGSTAKSIYRCMDQSIASRLKPNVSHIKDKELIAFEPYGKRGGTFVNVDMTTKSGIRRAERMGLVPSGKADILFAMDLAFAGDHLFDRQHKGRMLGLFRHPVKRLESKFYYLQKADWEKTYRPDWANMSILEWATSQNKESNIMVKNLAGVGFHDTATEVDLRVAMRTLEKRFVVGLTDEMKESIRRFNIVMNIDLTTPTNQRCMRKFFGHGNLKTNSNSHPSLEPGSPAWDVLAQDNALDIQLYEYIVQLFDQQREVINSYATIVNEIHL
mmetsp:Transcript_8060/g.11631  ORF Transcript_8060/g.11631 Transcript_8060/m.11631 type:complete len:355 (-) Transcript_8060:33-1097(-)